LSYIFGTSYGNPLTLLTGGLNRTETITNRQYQWRLMGNIEEPIAIVGNYGDLGSTPGLAGIPFRIKLAKKFFVSGEVLVLDNRDYPLIVVDDPYQDGVAFTYTLKLLSPDPSVFVPPSLLTSGKQISKDYSAFEEGSTRSGITTYSTPFMLRNQLTTQRKTYEITGSAATDVMAIVMQDPKTKKQSSLWADVQQWTAYEQWYREQERSLVYSTYNAKQNGTVDLLGASGRPVYIGSGLREQISPANKRSYTVLTENIIRDFLMDLSYNVIDKGQRKFVALCGEFFMDAFDKAMRASVKGFNLIDTHFVTGTGQNLELGGQYTSYKGLNGTEITLMHMPMYDDVSHNRQFHPQTGRPLESYRATFIDFGMYDGKSNIQKIAKEGRENLMWQTAGAHSVSGGSSSISNIRSNTMDGYAVHMLAETGMKIQNPLSCGELICNAA
jgi:hypothetical protein